VIDKAFRKIFPLPISCHFEVAKGSAAQNTRYCSKEDSNPIIIGSPKKTEQGKRSDLENLMHDIKNGATMLEIAEKAPSAWAQYRRQLAEYQQMVQPKRTWVTKAIYLWGPTGTGKTMHAQELEPTTVSWTGNSNFLIGYNGSDKILLFDDFDYKRMDWQIFLTMTDRYKMVVNIKGGSCNFAPEIIIFTSNSDPLTWWPDAPEQTRKAIQRRMTEYGEIRYMGELIPKEQNILTKYLKPKGPTVSAASEQAGAASHRDLPAAQEEVVILESDNEDEEENKDTLEYSPGGQLVRRETTAYAGASGGGYFVPGWAKSWKEREKERRDENRLWGRDPSDDGEGENGLLEEFLSESE